MLHNPKPFQSDVGSAPPSDSHFTAVTLPFESQHPLVGHVTALPHEYIEVSDKLWFNCFSQTHPTPAPAPSDIHIVFFFFKFSKDLKGDVKAAYLVSFTPVWHSSFQLE